MSFVSSSIKLLIKFMVISLLIITILVFYLLWKFSPDLPSYSELKNYKPSLTTRVFTSDGMLLDEYFIEERLFVPIEKIPKNLIYAFISAEDKNFYNHFGIDLLSIISATIKNISNLGSNKRLIQRTNGYRETIISGKVAFQNGESTGIMNGNLVRN